MNWEGNGSSRGLKSLYRRGECFAERQTKNKDSKQIYTLFKFKNGEPSVRIGWANGRLH
jgi:hypothetical protein